MSYDPSVPQTPVMYWDADAQKWVNAGFYNVVSPSTPAGLHILTAAGAAPLIPKQIG